MLITDPNFCDLPSLWEKCIGFRSIEPARVGKQEYVISKAVFMLNHFFYLLKTCFVCFTLVCVTC